MTTRKKKVMINETAARLFGWADPIGKSFLKSDSYPGTDHRGNTRFL